MNKITGAIVAVALIAASGTAFGAPNHKRAVKDLDALVQANLGEAATLRAQVPALRREPAAVRVWRFMIRDHTNGAHMLARLDRSLGGTPDMTPPAAPSVEGTPHAIIAKVLQAHLDTLRTVQGMQKHATGRELSALRAARAMVRHHIELIRSVARSSRHHVRRAGR